MAMHFKAALLTTVMAVTGGTAGAVTVSFDTFVSGTDLGNVEVATLSAEQVGSDVLFVLTATYTTVMTSYIDYLKLNYTLTPLPTTAQFLSGVPYELFSVGSGTDAGYSFNIDFDYYNTNKGGGALRLNPGESSTFKILNVVLGGFDFSSYTTLVHVNALADGSSTKYTGTPPTPTPVPAAGFLLAAGLAGLGLARRRKA